MLGKLSDLFSPLLLVGLVAGLIFAVFQLGSMSGAAEVTADWVADNKRTNELISKIQLENARKESTHQLESKRISDELAKKTAEYSASLAQLESVYAQRVLDSGKRADTYKRQAQGSTAERDALAEHAANLDRSLTEGRRLVKELRDTLEQRELAIGALWNQILLDRNLFSESSE